MGVYANYLRVHREIPLETLSLYELKIEPLAFCNHALLTLIKGVSTQIAPSYKSHTFGCYTNLRYNYKIKKTLKP